MLFLTCFRHVLNVLNAEKGNLLLTPIKLSTLSTQMSQITQTPTSEHLLMCFLPSLGPVLPSPIVSQHVLTLTFIKLPTKINKCCYVRKEAVMCINICIERGCDNSPRHSTLLRKLNISRDRPVLPCFSPVIQK